MTFLPSTRRRVIMTSGGVFLDSDLALPKRVDRSFRTHDSSFSSQWRYFRHWRRPWLSKEKITKVQKIEPQNLEPLKMSCNAYVSKVSKHEKQPNLAGKPSSASQTSIPDTYIPELPALERRLVMRCNSPTKHSLSCTPNLLPLKASHSILKWRHPHRNLIPPGSTRTFPAVFTSRLSSASEKLDLVHNSSHRHVQHPFIRSLNCPKAPKHKWIT